MKTPILFLTVGLLGLTSVGCQSQSTSASGEPEKIITVPEEVSDSFYDNVSEWGTLTLETSERSLLGNIFKIRIHKGRIFLLNGNGDNQRLSIYDKNSGRFITHVGFQGRGPGEYVNLSNFEIDPTRDELVLVDNYGQKILLFDWDGKFKREVPLSLPLEYAGRLPDGRFVFGYSPLRMRDNESYAISICDENGEVLERLIPHKINETISFSLGSNDMMSAQSDGSLSFMPQFHNTVYRIDEKGVTAEIGIEIPGTMVTVDVLDRVYNDPINDFPKALEEKDHVLLGNHSQSDTYLFFTNQTTEHVFYNKISGQSLRAKHRLFGHPVFIDDQGCFWASLRSVPEEADDELSTRLRQALDTGDNMPLFYYKLKI